MEGCFLFSSRRRHTRFDCDWSSDVCSSDLLHGSPMMLQSQSVELSCSAISGSPSKRQLSVQFPLGDRATVPWFVKKVLRKKQVGGCPSPLLNTIAPPSHPSSRVAASRPSSNATMGLVVAGDGGVMSVQDRKSTRLNSSHSQISYAGFCLTNKRRSRG